MMSRFLYFLPIRSLRVFSSNPFRIHCSISFFRSDKALRVHGSKHSLLLTSRKPFENGSARIPAYTSESLISSGGFARKYPPSRPSLAWTRPSLTKFRKIFRRNPDSEPILSASLALGHRPSLSAIISKACRARLNHLMLEAEDVFSFNILTSALTVSYFLLKRQSP